MASDFFRSYVSPDKLKPSRKNHCIFQGAFSIEEKVDGSQLSFGVWSGEIFFRSMTKVFKHGDQGGIMFKLASGAIEKIKDILDPALIYRGEAITCLRTNRLEYKRVPPFFFVLYDVEQKSCGTYLSPQEKAQEASRLGLEVAPLLKDELNGNGEVPWEFIDKCLSETSFLGVSLREGVVIKNYAQRPKNWTTQIMALKYVRQMFSESLSQAPTPDEKLLTRASKAHLQFVEKTKKDVSFDDFLTIVQLAVRLDTDARIHKTIQHMQDDGRDPADAKEFEAEIRTDLVKEEFENIRLELLPLSEKYGVETSWLLRTRCFEILVAMLFSRACAIMRHSWVVYAEDKDGKVLRDKLCLTEREAEERVDVLEKDSSFQRIYFQNCHFGVKK